MAIIRVQAEYDLDWSEGCEKAAMLIDKNSLEFQRAVAREASRLYKKRHMTELNKARATIETRTHDVTATRIRRFEDNFRTPCSECGKYMYFSSRDKNWEKERQELYEAFADWHHTRCGP